MKLIAYQEQASASMAEIPNYIERRIRQPIPPGLCVVPGSTPVVSFGNSLTAKIATLSLNPSHREFQDKDGCELIGGERRLATHKSLGVSDLASAPPIVIKQVWRECQEYFHGRSYGWFNQLERILDVCGTSYCEGSACHLDLVQWATKQIWTKLPCATQSCLLKRDIPFFKEQLLNENIKLLLVNGRSAKQGFESAFGKKLSKLPSLQANGKTIRLYEGRVLDQVQVIAWSAFVQRGVSVGTVHLLAKQVKNLANID